VRVGIALEEEKVTPCLQGSPFLSS
jgi:hypothetical protein